MHVPRIIIRTSRIFDSLTMIRDKNIRKHLYVPATSGRENFLLQLKFSRLRKFQWDDHNNEDIGELWNFLLGRKHMRQIVVQQELCELNELAVWKWISYLTMKYWFLYKMATLRSSRVKRSLWWSNLLFSLYNKFARRGVSILAAIGTS